MRRRPAAVALAALLLLSGCQSPEQEAKGQLQEQVARVREAAEAGDAGLAVRDLSVLRTRVAEMRQNDLLTEQEAQRILIAALQVQANLSLLQVAPPAPLQPPIVNPAANSSTADGRDGADGAAGEDGRDGDNGARGRKGGKQPKGKGKKD